MERARQSSVLNLNCGITVKMVAGQVCTHRASSLGAVADVCWFGFLQGEAVLFLLSGGCIIWVWIRQLGEKG